jgi:hypothetical protein
MTIRALWERDVNMVAAQKIHIKMDSTNSYLVSVS